MHLDENSARKVTEEEPKFLEFEMSDDNVIFDDFPKSHNSHESSVHVEFSDFASQKGGTDARTEGSTALFESESKEGSLDALT